MNFEKKILLSTIEDEIPLWEVIWEINTVLEKENPNNFKYSIETLKNLYSKGLISLFKSRFGENINLGEVNDLEFLSVISDTENWNPVKYGENCIKVASTKKGEEYYWTVLESN